MSSLIDNTNNLKTIRGTIVSVFDLVYPVNSIYMSVGDVDPSVLFGGTWEKIEDTFLLASGSKYTLNNIGGEEEHTLTLSEMPSHQHDIRNKDGTGPHGLCATTATSGTDGTNWCFLDNEVDGTTNSSGDFMTTFVGNSVAHNNMPPYLVVNIWKRIE